MNTWTDALPLHDIFVVKREIMNHCMYYICVENSACRWIQEGIQLHKERHERGPIDAVCLDAALWMGMCSICIANLAW